MRAYAVFLLKILLTAALLLTVFSSVEPGKIRETLRELELWRLAALLIIHWITQAITAQRWRLLARSAGMGGPYYTFLRMHFVGMFFSIGLPSLVGGDAVKAYTVSRQAGRPLSLGITSVLHDRAIGLVVLLAYGTVAAFLIPIEWQGLPLIVPYLAFWITGGAALWLIMSSERFFRPRLSAEALSAAHRALQKLAAFHKSLVEMNLRAADIAQVIVLSLFNSALVILIVHQICAATRTPVALGGVAVLVPLIDILTMFPFSISGIGIREWSYVHLFPLLGMPPAAALGVALIASSLLIVRNLAGAVFVLGAPGLIPRPKP